LTPVEDVNAASAAQKYLLDFLYGKEFPWPVYGEGKRTTNITTSGFESVSLPADLEARCGMINRVIQDMEIGV
jgi:hypothetical protein